MQTKPTSALIVVDLQNAFCSDGGSFLQRGYQISNMDNVINSTATLVELYDNHAMPIVFTKLCYKPEYADGGLLVKKNYPAFLDTGAYIDNTWDSDIIDEFKAFSADKLCKKNRYDPFISTHLESELKKQQVGHVVITGLTTNVCVESTARTAFDKNFNVTVIADAVSSYSDALHHASLENINRHFGRVLYLDAYINELDKILNA